MPLFPCFSPTRKGYSVKKTSGESHKDCAGILQVLNVTLTEQCLSQWSKAFTLALIIFPITVSHFSSLIEIHSAWLKFLGREGFLCCPSKSTALKSGKQGRIISSKWLMELVFTSGSLKSFLLIHKVHMCYATIMIVVCKPTPETFQS